MVNFVAAVAYHFWKVLPAAFTQPETSFQPSTVGFLSIKDTSNSQRISFSHLQMQTSYLEALRGEKQTRSLPLSLHPQQQKPKPIKGLKPFLLLPLLARHILYPTCFGCDKGIRLSCGAGVGWGGRNPSHVNTVETL